MAASTHVPPPGIATEPRLREILGGATAFRVLAVVWAFAVTVIDARSGVIVHPLIAFSVLALLALWTGVIGMWAQSWPDRLLTPLVIRIDLVVAVVVVITDWVVYDGPHPQSFGSAWPALAVVSTAAILGWRIGTATGVALGSVSLAAAVVTGHIDGRLLALVGSLVLLGTTGAVSGYVVQRLRQAESEVADVRAREEFARTLHDGVLQTLAVVQRRSDDASLVELAREQEWELRGFISNGIAESPELVHALRQLAARTERHHPVRVEVVVIEPPARDGERCLALVGAATEAVANAAKHAAARRVTLCVDRDNDGIVVTVNDDGCGFDVDAVAPGEGLARSIRGRIAEVDGTVEIRSWPGRGTEVRLWVP